MSSPHLYPMSIPSVVIRQVIPTFITAKNLCCIGVLFYILDHVNEVGDFGEKWVIVREGVRLLAVVVGCSDIKNRLHIRVD